MSVSELSGAAILLLFRNKITTDWRSLCEACELDPDHHRTAHTMLIHKLRELRSVGLLTFQDRPSRFEAIEGPISVTENWDRLQNALQISLTQIADLTPVGRLIVNPFFGAPKAPQKTTDVFVLMPFSADLRPVYEDHIRPVGEHLGLSVARADDFFTARAIIEEIWNALSAARLIVADCTGRNPNVFYEIGIAHTLGKPVILITQTRADAPFDIRYIYNIDYEFTPRGMKLFEDRLTEAISHIIPKGSKA